MQSLIKNISVENSVYLLKLESKNENALKTEIKIFLFQVPKIISNLNTIIFQLFLFLHSKRGKNNEIMSTEPQYKFYFFRNTCECHS